MTLPPGSTSSLCLMPGLVGALVVVAAPGRPATFAEWSCKRPGDLQALLTHGPGTAWTDRAGERLLADVLDRGGVVLMQFTATADALKAQARVRRLTGVGAS